MDTHFRSSCGSHIVHMQKIWNRSHFFQKIFPHRVYFQNFRNRSGLPKKSCQTVHTQKVCNRSPFLQKICHIGYIAKNFENVLAFQNFFQKIFLWHPPADRTSAFQQYSMRQFAKFAKSPLYRGYFQNDTPLCCCFRKKFRKTSSPHHWLSVFYPRNVTQFSKKLEYFYLLTYHITDLELFLSHFCLKSKHQRSVLHSPSTGVISKICPSCAVVFRKNLKKTSPLHHWLSRFPPCFVTPFFNFFSKIFVSPLLTITFLPRKGHTCSKNFSKKTPHCWLSHFFCVLFLHSWKKVKNLPERE